MPRVVDESAFMAAHHDDPVSPELVLVDPVLRDRLLRESLHELLLARSETLRPTYAAVAVGKSASGPGQTLPGLPALPVRRPGRRRRPHLSSIVTATLVALFLALPSLAFLPPRQAPRIGSDENVPARRSSTIAWQPVRGADYYVFEVSAGGHLVKVEPVLEPSVTLRASLPPGRYAWRVFAGRGSVADHERRGPIAGGTVILE